MLTGSFSESIKRRCSVLQWNPDVATQLVVASDEDSSPALRVMGLLLQSLLFLVELLCKLCECIMMFAHSFGTCEIQCHQ